LQDISEHAREDIVPVVVHVRFFIFIFITFPNIVTQDCTSSELFIYSNFSIPWLIFCKVDLFQHNFEAVGFLDSIGTRYSDEIPRFPMTCQGLGFFQEPPLWTEYFIVNPDFSSSSPESPSYGGGFPPNITSSASSPAHAI
jgi:hypothetical protein